MNEGKDGRFRKFTRTDISDRDDNLDISWLRDDGDTEELGEPEDIAAEIMAELQTALSAIEALTAELEGDEEPLVIEE